MSFTHLDCETFSRWLDESRAFEVVDIRDPLSFNGGHIPGSLHLDNATVGGFIDRTPTTRPVVVVCYHGHSSQQAADWLSGQGFEKVYSLDGGFTHWAHCYPETVERHEGQGQS